MNRRKKATHSSTDDASSKKQKISIRDKTKSKVVKSKQKLNVLNKNGASELKISKVQNKNFSTNAAKGGAKRGRKPKGAKNNKCEKNTKVQNKSTVSDSEQVPAKRPKGRPRLNPKDNAINGKPEKKPKASARLLAVNGPSTNGIPKGRRRSASSKPSSKMANLSSAKCAIKGEKKVKQQKTVTSKTQLKMSSSPVRTESRSISMDSTGTTSKSSINKASDSKKANNKNSTTIKRKSSTTCNSKTKDLKKPARKRKQTTGLSIKSILSKKRGPRVASLNASAMVKLLCESDRDSSSVNSNSRSSDTSTTQSKKTSKSPSKSSNSPKPSSSNSKNTTKPRGRPSELNSSNSTKQTNQKKKKSIKEEKPKPKNSKKRKKKIKRKHNLVDKTVEIFDTRRFKRMASLNASAMMAATYLPESRPVKSNAVEVLPQSQCLLNNETTSNVSDTIEQVVRQWSTVQHIEISPGSNSNTDQVGKTTVQTTVKHVKMRGDGTVVETISTQFEQQSIIPQSSNGSRKHLPKAKTKAPRTKASKGAVSAVTQVASTQSSAFTPCASTSNSYLGSCSIESIAMLSSQPSSTFSSSSSSSLSVQNFHHQNSLSDSNGLANRRRMKEKTPTNQDGKKKSRSIIRKYEVKTIETRMESTTVNDSSVHNSMLSNSVIFSNTNQANSLINSAGYISRLPEQSHLTCSMYPSPMAPFQVVPTAPSLVQQSPESLTPYINLAPFNAPLLHYQPFSNTLSPLHSFSSPISVPFLQLASAAPPYSYGLLNQRTSPMSMSSLFGLSYLGPHGNAGLYQPANPVFNILPPPSGIIHRPVAYHAQSGQAVTSTINSNTPNFINNSVFASSNGMASGPTNIFHCSPSIASIRHINLPVPTVPYSPPVLSTAVQSVPLTPNVSSKGSLQASSTYSNTATVHDPSATNLKSIHCDEATNPTQTVTFNS